MELSENAAAALESIRENQGIPEDHDPRLAAEPQPTGDLAVRLEFVEDKADDDQVAEQAGTEIYVDSQLVDALADVTMDVQQSEEGLAFVFRQPGA